MMNKNSYWLPLVLLIITVSVLSASFYFQYVQGLEPCPLCIMQRGCVALLALMGLLTVLLKGVGKKRVFTIGQIVIAAAGLFFAARQLWLQSLPADQVPACLPGLDTLIQYFPWQDVFHALFWGSGDCAEVNWQFLGLPMPAWTALFFLFMIAANSYYYWRLKKPI